MSLGSKKTGSQESIHEHLMKMMGFGFSEGSWRCCAHAIEEFPMAEEMTVSGDRRSLGGHNLANSEFLLRPPES